MRPPRRRRRSSPRRPRSAGTRCGRRRRGAVVGDRADDGVGVAHVELDPVGRRAPPAARARTRSPSRPSPRRPPAARARRRGSRRLRSRADGPRMDSDATRNDQHVTSQVPPELEQTNVLDREPPPGPGPGGPPQPPPSDRFGWGMLIGALLVLALAGGGLALWFATRGGDVRVADDERGGDDRPRADRPGRPRPGLRPGRHRPAAGGGGRPPRPGGARARRRGGGRPTSRPAPWSRRRRRPERRRSGAPRCGSSSTRERRPRPFPT